MGHRIDKYWAIKILFFITLRLSRLHLFVTCSTTAVIAPDAVVCDEATLEGDITIGPRCVIHPKAVIVAKDGPIVFGEGNLVEEYSKIVNR